MAKVEVKPEIQFSDITTVERVVCISLDESQIHEALFAYLRLNGITLPSQDIMTYDIDITEDWGRDRCYPRKMRALITYKQIK